MVAAWEGLEDFLVGAHGTGLERVVRAAAEELCSICAQSGHQWGALCALTVALEGGAPSKRRRSGPTDRKASRAEDVATCLACTQADAGSIVNLHCCLLEASQLKEVQTTKVGACLCFWGWAG